MAADIDAVAFVIDRARDAAHIRALFQNDRFDTGAGQQLIGGGEAAGAGADDHRLLVTHAVRDDSSAGRDQAAQFIAFGLGYAGEQRRVCFQIFQPGAGVVDHDLFIGREEAGL